MRESFIKAVSSELKILRIENNYLQESLANKSGVASSTISKYENGDNNINLDKLAQIVSAYDMDLYIFFERVIAKTQRKQKEGD